MSAVGDIRLQGKEQSVGEPIEMRSPIGVMQLLDGVIVHTIDEGAIVTSIAAAGVIEVTRMLADRKPVAVVVDLRNVGFADKGSRNMFATNPAGGVEVATALVANARVSQFLADLFLREELTRPTSVFEDLTAARAWAAEQLRNHLDQAGETNPGIDRPTE